MSPAADFGHLPDPGEDALADGRVGRTHRFMQLQGYILGHGLQEIPDDVLHDVDLPYRRRSGATREIPFVDAFSINRVLGGYRRLWMERAGMELRDLDFAVRDGTGALRFRPELLERRLAPYLEAGYALHDMTLNVEHVPWDLAADGGHEGVFGQRKPPGDWDEWQRMLSALGAGLRDLFGDAVSDLRFKIGNEYDTTLSFGGTRDDYFRMYETSCRTLREYAPGAGVMPGEFTGTGACGEASKAGVFDMTDLMDFARSRDLPVDVVPRSLHGSLNRTDYTSDEAVARAVTSYERIAEAAACATSDLGIELHQFGLIGQPFGVFHQAGSDPAALQACWQFHTLLALRDALPVRRVAHWDGFSRVGRLSLLNGTGFLRLVLDHVTDARVGAAALSTPEPDAVRAAMFTSDEHLTCIVASVDYGAHAADHAFTLEWPAPAADLRATAYDETNNPFRTIKDELREEGNLRTEYARHERLLGEIQQMAADVPAAARLVHTGWSRYAALVRDVLRWKPVDRCGPSLSVDGRRITGRLRGNTMLVLRSTAPSVARRAGTPA